VGVRELKIDQVCQMLEEAHTQREIAAKFKVAPSSLTRWLADPQRSARAKDSRAAAAVLWDERAQEGIESAADPFELAKAKELAHHYRWRASKIAPKVYGDKLELAGELTHKKAAADMTDDELLALAKGRKP